MNFLFLIAISTRDVLGLELKNSWLLSNINQAEKQVVNLTVERTDAVRVHIYIFRNALEP